MAVIRFIRNEPAAIVSVIVAVLVTFGFDVSQAGQVSLRDIIDGLMILTGGGIVRQSVTPTAKLTR